MPILMRNLSHLDKIQIKQYIESRGRDINRFAYTSMLKQK